MVGISCEQNSWVSSSSSSNLEEEEEEVTETQSKVSNFDQEGVFDLERDEIWKKVSESSKKSFTNSNNSFNFNSNSRSNSSNKKKNQVLLEGYVEIANTNNNENEDDLKKTKSLTDDDLDELKGCLDLGFGFSYDEIPELCNTLPALELCYSMSQKFLDDQNKSPERSSFPTVAESASSSPIANWKISSPGDHPEDVKARLKFWAQAVACTVRLCS